MRDDPWTEKRNPDGRFEDDGWNPDDSWIDAVGEKDPFAVICCGGGGG